MQALRNEDRDYKLVKGGFMWFNIITICISVIAVCVSIGTFVWAAKRDKTRDTIKAYEDLQTFLYHFYEYPDGEIETFVNDKNSDEFKALSNSLARLEILSTGVRKEIYDFEIVYKMAHGYLDGVLRDKIDYMLYLKSGNSNQFYANTQKIKEKMDNKSRN